MNKTRKRFGKIRLLLCSLPLLLSMAFFPMHAQAGHPAPMPVDQDSDFRIPDNIKKEAAEKKAAKTKYIDEILDYTITIDVNQDATLNMYYHIDWLVLESKKNGAVDWVEVGIPNGHVKSYAGRSDNIRTIRQSNSNGESTMKIYFDKAYEEGEVISFDFMIVQDNMYQMNMLKQGETVYEFTPGWFKDIPVDQLTIKWKNDEISSFSPSCIIEDGYHIWETSLDAGKRYKVSITYPNDAFSFKTSSTLKESTSGNYFVPIFGVVFSGIWVYVYVFLIVRAVRKAYKKGANFGTTTETKITRTKIVYFPECPHCAAARQEGQETCIYCGTNLIKSEEIVKEETIRREDQSALDYKTDGTYRYTSQPNTYLRVHVAHVPVSRPARSSSCFHSSCACASHCACACACACAGGGRAGCSTKDFYNTNLKLRQLKRKEKTNKIWLIISLCEMTNRFKAA